MTNPILPGQPINPNSLEKILKDYLTSIRAKVQNFIPLGSIFSYVFTAVKTFRIRPKAVNASYSNRTQLLNNQVDLTQPNANSAFLGTPWTLSLGQSLGLSLSGSQSIDSQSPTYKKEDIYLYNPSTDLAYGGLPLKGNSPFIFNGYLGFSNNVEDLNVRLLPGTDGYSMNIRAKRLSLIIRETSASDYTITNDSITFLTDRKAIELVNSTNVDLTISATAGAFVASTAGATSGFFPTVPTLSGDYGLWVVRDNVNNINALAITSWATDYATVNGIVSTPHVNWYGSNARFEYIRCVGCVRMDISGTDRKFNVSTKQAWGETSSSYNANPFYGQIYQQVTSPNPVVRQQTVTTDRRIVPSQYYMEGSNSFFTSRVCYTGLMRHVPGAGSHNLKYRFGLDGGTATTSFEFGSLELTDGTSSIWLSGNLELSNFSPVGTSIIPNDLGGSLVNGSAYYYWLTANPKSILDTAANAPNNNLRLKLVTSFSPTWSGLSSVFKSANTDYTYRARVGWFIYDTSISSQKTSFEAVDGWYYFKPGYGTGVENNCPNYSLVSGSSTSATTWSVFSVSKKIPTGSNGSNAQIKWIEGFSVMSNNGAQFNETLQVSTTLYGGSLGGTVGTDGTRAAIVLRSVGTASTASSHISQTFKFPVTSSDLFFYNTSGGATGAATKEVVVTGFELPITYI
jgi:hypothetical protein